MKITVTYTIEEPTVERFLKDPEVIACYEKWAEKDFSLDNLDEDTLLDIAFEYFDEIFEWVDGPEWHLVKESN